MTSGFPGVHNACLKRENIVRFVVGETYIGMCFGLPEVKGGGLDRFLMSTTRLRCPFEGCLLYSQSEAMAPTH